jgi:hypothetical protein
MVGRGSAAFLVWYWSLPSWSGWLAAWVSADRPPGRDILYGTQASGLADKKARNDPESHRATGGMVKVSSNRRTRRSHRPAPKKINHDG